MGAKGVAGGGGVSKESTMAWLRHDLPVSSFVHLCQLLVIRVTMIYHWQIDAY